MPYSSMQHVVTHIRVNAAEHLQAKLHDCVRCYFAFKKMRWSGRLDINITRRIESLMFDIIARWEHALEDIERAAQVNGRTAKYVVAATRLNRCAIYQRYASHMQDLADQMPDDLI